MAATLMGRRCLPAVRQFLKMSAPAPAVPRVFAVAPAYASTFGGVAIRAFSETRFTQTHEWLRIDGETGVIGISDYAQGALGEVVYCDLPSEGATFSAKDTLCTLESVKAVGEVYAPCDLEVVEVNEQLADEPALVNSGPESDGWLVKVKFSGDVPSDLMDRPAYDKHVEAAQSED
eukprot:TRINITY_DN761_c0_g1_i1.p2 TRINITY_DN761_c0_g1~~TRINITY_DN761_c0_g1_i1.p2  ORF type:complete len:176 (-),score=31.21 TRINITY_DN761_c0_g1_i1:228-755(-)